MNKTSRITKEEVLNAQNDWKSGIIDIGNKFINNEDYELRAIEHLNNLYAYKLTDVLFKPTKVSKVQFRSTFEQALSYFVATNNECEEDSGFAINPWIDVRFENSSISLLGNTALAMGNYFFTDKNKKETKVEYTFGYIKNEEGKLLINLHHSSVPFSL